MKKVISIVSILILSFLLVGCTKETSKNIEGSLSEIMDRLYEGIDENEMPSLADNLELTEDIFPNFAFADNVKYKEAIVSEPVIGSIPHSVVLIRLEDQNDAEQVVNNIKALANPRKWVCTEAENVYVLSKGDLVVLIMSNELAPKIKANFENLK
ncbi:MAG: hypothetical protein HFI09_01130 [Bacilli bacterium]|nr:hypothetical protein [Bacilli bacterium]